MCDHHHAARHILCPQCDLLVALPQLEHRQKAACPRCGTTLTTTWDAPRQRPTAYALVALFMLLLANLFPFIYMKVGGISSEIELLEIPNVLFTEDYASLGTFFYSLCSWYRRFAWSPFCCWSIGSECPPVSRRSLRVFCST